MHAMVQHRYGRASEVLRLEEVETPEPGEGEVLVRVEASSANPYDWHTIRGEPWIMRLGSSGLREPKRSIPGGDFAGTVAAIGSGDVGGFVEGDEVYGFHDGAFAEYLVAPHHRMAKRPDGLTWEEAASLPLAAATALQGLNEVGGLVADQKVLIIGASGGIGSLAVQMAKMWEAEVTAVSSTPNADLAASLGADRFIDYKKEDYSRGEGRYDLIFQLGGTASPRALRRVLTANGTLVQCAGDGSRALGPVPNVIMANLMNRFADQHFALVMTREDTATLDTVREMIEAGALRPVIDHAVDFRDAGFAVDEVQTGSPRGKIAISGYDREAPLD